MSVTFHDDSSRARIRNGLMFLAGPAWDAGYLAEMRALDTPRGTVSGVFDREHLDQMVDAAWEWSGAEEEIRGEARKTLGVYVTLNGLKPDCLARAANRVKTYARHTTSAEDIARRYWLMIDCDTITAVSKVSATDQEKERTKAAVATVRDGLTARGLPMPALVDTGNGYTLYYRIDLPADDGGLVSRVLEAIKAAFPGIGAKIDTSVCNADRLCKIPGTLAAKGDHTAERPHRISALIDAPETLEIVTREQLEELAGASQSSPMPAAYDAAIEAHVTAVDRPRRVEVIAGQRDPDKPGFDLKAYLVKHGFYRADMEPKPWDKADGKGMLYELERCPLDEHAKSRKAYAIQFESGGVAAGCHSDDCKKLGASWEKFRDVIEPGWRTKAEEKPAILTPEAACLQAGGSVASNGDLNFDGEATEALKLLGIDFETPTNLKGRAQKMRLKKGRLYVQVRGQAVSEKAWNIPGWSYDSGWWELCIKGWQESAPDDDTDKPKKIDLHSFAFEGDEFFHSPEKEAFATAGGKTWPVKSETYKLLLRDRMYSQRGMTIPDNTLKEIVDTLTAKAIFSGPERSVYLRVAEHEGRNYVDLANERWEAVEISPEGWRIVSNPPVRFVRKDGMLPLPAPTHGGKISQLREFLNVDDQSWPLVVMWLMAAMRPGGPYPMLMISGEHGSAKSSFARLLRSLIDPSSVPHCKLPDSGRDLMITAKNSYVLSFDNLSHVPTSMSDLLCSLATRGGYRTRKGYTDDSEMLFSYARPQMLNGISEFATRGDLLSRAFSITLPVVTARKKEAELYAAFEAAKPAILGALFTAAAYGLKRLEAVKAKRLELPRMADAIEWCIATEGGLGFADGEFARAVWANENNATDAALASSPVATVVLKLMADRSEWHGTASELLAELNRVAGVSIIGTEGKPLLAHKLSKAMSEAAPDLRRRGVEVEIRTKTPKGITLTALAEKTVAPAKPISGGRLYDLVQAMKAQLVATGCAPEQALEIAIAATSAAYPYRTVIDGMVFRSAEALSDEEVAKLREHVPGWLAEIRANVREFVAAAEAFLRD